MYKGSIFPCCLVSSHVLCMTVNPFYCPNEAPTCKWQCWGIVMVLWCQNLQLGETHRKVLCKFESNLIDGFWDIIIFVSPSLFFWTMSGPTSSAPTPVLCQAPVNVPLPTYDWNVADQMWGFWLFKSQLDTWFWLWKIKAVECLDYLLCILGKDGYAAMDHWVPPDEAHKWDPERFLDYLESTLDDAISPWVCIYELEDVKKRSDESVNELIDRICQLTFHAQIGNVSNAAIEFEDQCRLIPAIPDVNIELWKELFKVNCNKKVSHLLEISHTYYTIESGVVAKCAGKAIHALHQGCQSQKNKPQSAPHNAPTIPVHTPLAMTTDLHRMPSARAVPKKVTGMQSATALVLLANNPLSLMELRRPPIIDAVVRGRKWLWYKSALRKHPHAMSCSSMQ